MKINSLKIMIAGFLTIHSINLYSAEPVQLESRFDLDEVKWIQVQGNSSVNGTAFISLSESERKGCAGFNVELLPVAKYSNERILKIYGNNVSGKVLLKNNPPTFTPDHPQYHEMVRKSKCNNNSHFSFEDIPAGEYYVMVFVISEDEKGQSDGGVLMHRISVAAAEHKVVDISK